MSFFNLLLVTLKRHQEPPLSGLRVPSLSELKVRHANCINIGLISLFNLSLLTLERCPVPPLSDLRVQPLSE